MFNMKRPILTATVVALLALVGACGGDSVRSNQGAIKEWYQNGTLHRSTAADWKDADDRDRLATSSDFAAIILNRKEISLRSTDELRPYAEDMCACINQTVLPDPIVPGHRVSEIAAACAALMNW